MIVIGKMSNIETAMNAIKMAWTNDAISDVVKHAARRVLAGVSVALRVSRSTPNTMTSLAASCCTNCVTSATIILRMP
jgi:hypothetical protein